MDIPWRSSLLFIVAVAGILFAVATRSLVVLQGLTMLAFAILGVLAVVLVRRGARSIPSDPRLVRVAERLRELRRLAASARQDFPEDLDGGRRTNGFGSRCTRPSPRNCSAFERLPMNSVERPSCSGRNADVFDEYQHSAERPETQFHVGRISEGSRERLIPSGHIRRGRPSPPGVTCKGAAIDRTFGIEGVSGAVMGAT